MTSLFSKFKSTAELTEYIQNIFTDMNRHSTAWDIQMRSLYQEALIYFQSSTNYTNNQDLYIDLAFKLFNLTDYDVVTKLVSVRDQIYFTAADIFIALLHNTNHNSKIIDLISITNINLDPLRFLPKCTNSADALSYFNGYCGGEYALDEALISFMGPKIYWPLSSEIKECIFECLYDYKTEFNGDAHYYLDNIFILYKQLDLKSLNVSSDFFYKLLAVLSEFEQKSKGTDIYCDLTDFINEVKELGQSVYGTSFETIYNTGMSLNCGSDMNFWRMARRNVYELTSNTDTVIPEIL